MWFSPEVHRYTLIECVYLLNLSRETGSVEPILNLLNLSPRRGGINLKLGSAEGMNLRGSMEGVNLCILKRLQTLRSDIVRLTLRTLFDKTCFDEHFRSTMQAAFAQSSCIL